MEHIQTALSTALEKLGYDQQALELSIPEAHFGDASTNVALRLANGMDRRPLEVANELAQAFSAQLGSDYWVEVVDPGFINIRYPDQIYIDALGRILRDGSTYGHSTQLEGKLAVIEGTDPNPFKHLHIGHLYSNTIGEALSGLHEAHGAEVKRVNYQGDVGRHVACALWGMQQSLGDQSIDSVPEEERVDFLSKAYAAGASAFKDGHNVDEVKMLNKLIYDQDPSIAELYTKGRQWSLDYFEQIYQRLQTRFDAYYFESDCGPVGLKIVHENPEVFEESDGAIIYRGEQDGLHTRVFVNSQGLPTYEAKELGLSALKEKDFNPDISITFTGNEIVEYFKVVIAALSKIDQPAADKITHIAHGMVRLPSGKMSSRTGEVITAVELLDEVAKKVREQSPDSPSVEENTLGAIKYSLLKHRIGGNIIYDVDESISLEGNSGPYVQYAHARASRVLEKLTVQQSIAVDSLEEAERLLIRDVVQLPDVLKKALETRSPHVVCNYLYAVAKQFNRFYEHHTVVSHEREALRGAIVLAVQSCLASGLSILNIPAPKKM